MCVLIAFSKSLFLPLPFWYVSCAISHVQVLWKDICQHEAFYVKTWHVFEAFLNLSLLLPHPSALQPSAVLLASVVPACMQASLTTGEISGKALAGTWFQQNPCEVWSCWAEGPTSSGVQEHQLLPWVRLTLVNAGRVSFTGEAKEAQNRLRWR